MTSDFRLRFDAGMVQSMDMENVRLFEDLLSIKWSFAIDVWTEDLWLLIETLLKWNFCGYKYSSCCQAVDNTMHAQQSAVGTRWLFRCSQISSSNIARMDFHIRSSSIACSTSQNQDLDFYLWHSGLASLTTQRRVMDFCIERSGVYCSADEIAVMDCCLWSSGLVCWACEIKELDLPFEHTGLFCLFSYALREDSCIRLSRTSFLAIPISQQCLIGWISRSDWVKVYLSLQATGDLFINRQILVHRSGLLPWNYTSRKRAKYVVRQGKNLVSTNQLSPAVAEFIFRLRSRASTIARLLCTLHWEPRWL